MSKTLNQKSDPFQPTIYQIRIQGHLGDQWTDWFNGLIITLEEDGNTLLTGPVVDQAALHGLLKKVRNLGMPLLSVNCVDPDQADVSADKPSGSILLSRQARLKKEEEHEFKQIIDGNER